MGHRVARLGVGNEGFRTRRLPVHGPAELACADHHRDVFRIDRRLHAESAADVFGDHPQLFVRHAHDGGRLAAQGVGALRADVQRVAVAFLVVDAGGAARFHRSHDQALVGHADARHMRRLLNEFGDLALVLLALGPSRPVDAEIARRLFVEPDVPFNGRVEIDDRRQFLVLDLHQIGGVQRRRGAFRHHHDDRIADVHHLVAGQRRAERQHHLGAAAARPPADGARCRRCRPP